MSEVDVMGNTVYLYILNAYEIAVTSNLHIETET